MDDLEVRQRRLDRARSLIQAQLTIAIFVPLVSVLLFIAAPQFTGGSSRREPALIESIAPCLGIAMYLVGLVWMVRLSRSYREEVESAWRYRDRQRRLDRARSLIRAELAIAIAVPLVAGFLFIAAPHTFGAPEPAFVQSIVAVVGVALYIVGLVWMIRLSRANPENGESAWRYRDF